MSARKLLFIQSLIALQFILIAFLFNIVLNPSQDRLKATYYETQAATLVSPHSLRENFDHGEENYIIVDTREAESYRQGHITTAINIVPGRDMVEKFRNLEMENPETPILIYCYTEVCMRGRKVGRELSQNGIFVQELGIGFNEWKNYWKKWNYESEWEYINIDDYITVGDEPGEFDINVLENILKRESCSSNPNYSC